MAQHESTLEGTQEGNMTIDAADAVPAGPATPIGLPALVKMAFDNVELAPLWNMLALRAQDDPHDAAALMDLSMIAHIQGRPDDRAALQGWALEVQRIYRQPAASIPGA